MNIIIWSNYDIRLCVRDCNLYAYRALEVEILYRDFAGTEKFVCMRHSLCFFDIISNVRDGGRKL